MNKLATTLLLLSFSLPAFADYTFDFFGVEVSKDKVEVSGTDIDGYSYIAQLNKELEDEVFVGGGLYSGSVDYSDAGNDIEVDQTALALQFGKYFAISSDGKFVITATFLFVDTKADINGTSYSDTENGPIFSADVILPATSNFDVLFGVSHSELGDGADSFSVGASLDTTEKTSVECSYEQGDDTSSIGVALRVKTN